MTQKDRANEHRDAAMYGASKAALILQSELLNSGHIDAAKHIAKMLNQYGMGMLKITQSS